MLRSVNMFKMNDKKVMAMKTNYYKEWYDEMK